MRILLDRNLCGPWAPACEECFGVFVARGFPPDRACLIAVEEDGLTEVQVIVRSGHFVGRITITDQNRGAVVQEGWRIFSTLPDEAFEILPPHGDYFRQKRLDSHGW